MPLLRERLEQPNKQPNSFPASTGQDSCRRAVRIVDIDQKRPRITLVACQRDLLEPNNSGTHLRHCCLVDLDAAKQSLVNSRLGKSCEKCRFP